MREPLSNERRDAWIKALMKYPKAHLAERLQELLEALSDASDTFENINVAAYYGGELMDKKKRGGREKLDYIESQALGGHANAIGVLEIGRPRIAA